MSVGGPLTMLQAFRFGESDRDHVSRLLHWADFPNSARIVDLGAGSGGVAAHMAALRSDLRFCLVDLDETKLAASSFEKHIANITQVPEPDGAFDAAICCYAMGYAPSDALWSEISRLLRPGGTVFIVDMVPKDATIPKLSLFGYEIRSRGMVEEAAQSVGLIPDVYIEPYDSGDWGRSVFSDAFDVFFGDLRPAIWCWRAPETKTVAHPSTTQA
ncbi:methyltransferase domain-containing protein [Sinorhizobium medicae]|nr:methyltransferase domain-containing protein [Sinorhizobium medicae]